VEGCQLEQFTVLLVLCSKVRNYLDLEQ
jgi:hypothetical protein